MIVAERLIETLSFWTELANVAGLNVSNVTYCFNTTFVNVGVDASNDLDSFARRTVASWTSFGNFFFDPPEPIALPVLVELHLAGKTNFLVDGDSPLLFSCSYDPNSPECINSTSTNQPRFPFTLGMTPPRAQPIVTLLIQANAAGIDTALFFATADPLAAQVTSVGTTIANENLVATLPTITVPSNATYEDMKTLLKQAQSQSPDLLIEILNSSLCDYFIHALYELQYTPSAVFSYCLGSPSLELASNASEWLDKAHFFLTYTVWDSRLQGSSYVSDFFFTNRTLGPAPQQFALEWLARFGTVPPDIVGPVIAAGSLVCPSVLHLRLLDIIY